MKIRLQPTSLVVLALIAGSLSIVGCGSGAENPNYSTEIKKSEEDKAREAQNMAGQKAPGSAPGATAASGGAPGTLTVPGKGGH